MSRFAEWHAGQAKECDEAVASIDTFSGHEHNSVRSREMATFHREAAAAIREAENALGTCEAYFDRSETSEEAWDLMQACRAALAKLRGEK